jgi:hypothetical protein
VNWRSCWSRFKYGRGPSGHHRTPAVNRRRKDTTGSSSRRRGAHTAQTTSRRHNREISGICGACNGSHPTFSSRSPRLGSEGVTNSAKSSQGVRFRRAGVPLLAAHTGKRMKAVPIGRPSPPTLREHGGTSAADATIAPTGPLASSPLKVAVQRPRQNRANPRCAYSGRVVK